jgi:hypothetical protein
MLKQAFEAGEKTAYDLFKIAGLLALPSLGKLNIRERLGNLGQGVSQAVQGQMGHLGNLGQGVKGMFASDPAAHMAARAQAWEGLKGALPTLGGAAALGLGAYGLSGPSEEEKRQHMMQQMMMAHGGM